MAANFETMLLSFVHSSGAGSVHKHLFHGLLSAAIKSIEGEKYVPMHVQRAGTPQVRSLVLHNFLQWPTVGGPFSLHHTSFSTDAHFL